MAKIKIEDLPEDMKISKEELKKILGGQLITRFSNVKSNSMLYNISKLSDGAMDIDCW
jgi:hypothetical protein